MKKILFLMIAVLTIIGCSKEDDTDITFNNIDDYYKNQKVYYDGKYYIPYVKNNYVYKFSEDGNLIWKNKIEYPPTTTSESYGEKIELEYKDVPSMSLFKENYALHFQASTPVTTSTIRYTYIDICSNSGKLVKRIKLDSNITMRSWANDLILITSDYGYKDFWLSSKGEEIEFQHKEDLFFYESYLPINNIGYVTYSSSVFAIINFEKGNNLNVLHNFIRNNYGDDYKLNIINLKIEDPNIIVNATINMKDNKKYNLALKINATTFSCEKMQ